MTESAQKARKIFDNRYEILSIVGRGHCSVVYHARHLSAPASEVALKVLVEKREGGSTAERLRHEALALVQARHQFIIRLDDFHSVKDLCYLSMEYAPESDLRQFTVKRGSVLRPDLAIRFMTQMAEALFHLNSIGVVHRDIKPDNILIVDEGQARLGDFGVAILPGIPSSFEELQRGVGTLDYMAPEVLEGVRYDHQSDIYALGVSFYELITGVHPFSKVSLIDQIPIRRSPNFEQLRKLSDDIPAPLIEAIEGCMAFDSGSRFKSAYEIIKVLAPNRARRLAPSSDEVIEATAPADEGQEQAATSSAPGAEQPLQRHKPKIRPRKNRARAESKRGAEGRYSPAESDPIDQDLAAFLDELSRDLLQPEPSSESPTSSAPDDLSSPGADHQQTTITPLEDESSGSGDTETQVGGAIGSSGAVEENQNAPLSEPQTSGVDAVGTRDSSTNLAAQFDPVSGTTTPIGVVAEATLNASKDNPDFGTPTASTAARPRTRVRNDEQISSSKEDNSPNVQGRLSSTQQALAARGSRSKTMRIDREMVEKIRAASQEKPTQVIAAETVEVAPPQANRAISPGLTHRFSVFILTVVFFVLITVGYLLYDLSRGAPVERAADQTASQSHDSTSRLDRSRQALEAATFPLLPSGVYTGKITGILPGREAPLTMVAFPKRGILVVIVGVDGWQPAEIPLAAFKAEDIRAGKSKPVRIAANGAIIELTGTIQDGAVVGSFINLVNGDEGAWSVSLSM